MKVTKKNLKEETEFCYCCGNEITKKEYIINLGSAGSQFELCRPCLRKLHNRISKVLDAE